MNAIEIRNLNKSFDDFSLHDLCLSLPQGSILGLAGENGAGKSTTIKLIMNAIKRDSGTVTVLGHECTSPEFTDLKNEIGVVLDEANFPLVLNVKQVNGIMKNTFRNWDEEKYFELIKKFRLSETKKFKEYSRGMKMKLSIAVALSHNPKLLILDEATGGLDPLVRDEILDIFNDFTRDESHSIIMSSHIVSDIEKICDYFAFIHNGRLLLCDEKDKILSEYGIAKLKDEEFEALPKEAVHGFKRSSYEVEALLKKNMVKSDIRFEHTSLEDIIIFLAREEERK